MKKTVRVLLLFGFLFSLFAIPSYASGSEDEFWKSFTELTDADLPREYGDVLASVGIESLLSEILSAVGDGVGRAASFLVMLLGICVILSVAESGSPMESRLLTQHGAAAISMISAVLIFGAIGPLAFSVRDSLSVLSSFFSGLIPIMTGILSAGGNVSSAAAQAVNMNITLGIISYVSTSLMLPLVFALFALSLAQSTDSGTTAAVAKAIRGLFMWVLGIGTAVIIGAVSMQSIIAGAQDSAYLRAAKYAANGMIPVVGSTVSGALATLAGGLSYVKSAVGGSSVMIMIAYALSPLVTLLLYRFAFSVAISFLEILGVSTGARTLGAFRSALDSLISVYALSAVVYICEVVVFMKSGVNTFG